ncbi:HipA domain-containing protein [Rathayibacter festucae]|uniref:Type II toxin-antitoxin system HipA family toxin n=1 Tax=Rathayibacter festucae DSM 15932 TaxID=1328866 RepID=A0A3Q9UX98_9MICO|nr:HipA domain-containing protein [Rathayibacter festucae]AZZ50635.1 type II toxin-antitoxin system HipA family toxin [Rathayibacter festucae DSM 15932]
MAVPRELVAYLDGRRAGTFLQENTGDTVFVYDDEYRRDPLSTPLSLSMSKAVKRHGKRQVLPWLNGLLPDNDAARSAIAQRFDVNPRNPFAILEHTGSDAPGAVQLLPPGEESTDADSDRTAIETLADEDVAEQLRLVIDEYRDGTADARLDQRFSLPGAQPKIALVHDRRGWARALRATPTTHILKPVAPDGFRRVDVVEYVTLTAANTLGLATAEFWIQQIGPHRVFVSKRYDRAPGADGIIRRLHQEDLGQALSTDPAKKYQRRDGGPGIGAVATLIRALALSDSQRVRIGWEFFRGVAFNSVAYCTDAHIKNYSMMLDGAHTRLAPLYDLNTIAPYLDDRSRFGARGEAPQAAMSIDGEYRFDAMSEAGFAKEAKKLGVDGGRAVDEIRRLRRDLVGAFESARDSLVALDDDTTSFAQEVVDGVARIPSLNRS